MKKHLNPHVMTAFLLFFSMLPGGLCLQAEPKIPDEIAMRKRQTPDGIRVVTANLRQMMKEDYKTGNGWEQRKELCRDVIMAQNADIYCLQENRTEISAYLMAAMPGFALSNTIYRSKQPINPVMYSSRRFKKIKEGGFWLSPTPEVENSVFPGFTRRVANWVLLEDNTSGKQLYIINAHYAHDSEDARARQIEVMLNFAKTLPPDIAAVTTADFNCGIGSMPIKKILNAGWLDSYTAIHGPAEPGNTFHGFLGAADTKKRMKIDHVFHTKQLKPVAAEIIKDSRGGKYPSDHYFVSAELIYVK